MTHRFKSESRGFSAIHLSQPDEHNDRPCDDCPTAACGACDGPPACDTCDDSRTVGDPNGPDNGIWDVVDCPDCGPACPACGGPPQIMERLGNLTWYRCRSCGSDYNEEVSA